MHRSHVLIIRRRAKIQIKEEWKGKNVEGMTVRSSILLRRERSDMVYSDI